MVFLAVIMWFKAFPRIRKRRVIRKAGIDQARFRMAG